jgi:putative sterol carrier protein
MITYKDDAKRLVTGPVAIPDCPDCDFHRGEKLFTPDEIEGMVHEYNTKYQYSDEMHIFTNKGDAVGTSVENWTLKEPMTVKNIDNKTVKLPVGTWMTTIKVTDDDTWSKIESGELRGFSAMYVPKDDAERLLAEKRTLVKDLKDPVPVSIAIVDRPCVFDAIFTSVKAGRSISNATLEKLKNAYDTAMNSLENLKSLIEKAAGERPAEKSKSEVDDMDEKELAEIVGKVFDEKIKPITEKIEALETVEEDEPVIKEESEPEPVVNEELEALKSELKELKEKLGADVESKKQEGQEEIKSVKIDGPVSTKQAAILLAKKKGLIV